MGAEEEEEDSGLRRLIQDFERMNDALKFGTEPEVESDVCRCFWMGRGFGRGGGRNSAANG
jgi:hypothetical protein